MAKAPLRIQQADIRLLRVFQAISHAGGISAAETILNVGRSTISRQLSDLELRLGLKLCDRGAGGFALTEEGIRVLDATNQLLASVDNFAAEVDEVHNRLTGRLSIALFDMTLTNPNANVAMAFREFDRIAPDVSLRVRVLGADETEQGVQNGEIHIGIVPSLSKSTSLEYHSLFSESMYLFCGASHPLFARRDKSISPREIRAARYAGLEFHSPNMVVSQKERFNRNAQANDQEALAILVRSGRYIGYLPDHFAQPYSDEGQIRKLRPDRYSYESEFFAVTRSHPKPSRITRVFLNCLKAAHA